MGLAIDTIGSWVTAGATNPKALAAGTPSTGDSFTVRNFVPPAGARLEAVLYNGSLATQMRVESPMFHDNVTGLTWSTPQSPAIFLLPKYTGQQLTAGDTLSVSHGTAAGASSVMGLVCYYDNLPGAAARLHSWGDISGIIKNLKTWQVTTTTNATVGQWTDTLINTTDKQFHAGSDYAILGFQTDVACAVVGVKGQETGNLRICGPGTGTTDWTSDYFVSMSERHGTPHIPVFNADNYGSFYVSTLHNVASVTVNVYVVAAELAHTITP